MPEVVPNWQIIPCEEHGLADIDSARYYTSGELNIYQEVLDRVLVRIQVVKRQLQLFATGYIGLIPLNDQIALDVRPKVPVANLDRLLSVTQHVPILVSDLLRKYAQADKPLSSILDLIAEGYLAAIEIVVAEGRLRQYERHERRTSFPRGRILVGETLSQCQSEGRYDQVITSSFEQTSDISVNRLLKYALWKLAQRYVALPRDPKVKALFSRLNYAFRAFDGIYLDHSLAFRDDPFVREPERLPSIRDYYRRAVDLAKLITSDGGIQVTSTAGRFVLPTLLFNLDDVFEAYVGRVLQLALVNTPLRALDGNVDKQSGGASKYLFDAPNAGLGGRNPATPDVVIQEGVSGKARAIVEVKYKRFTGVAERADVAQTITYAATYRASIAVVVHPKMVGGVAGLRFVGNIDNIALYQFALDLEDQDFLAQERSFVQAIVGLVST